MQKYCLVLFFTLKPECAYQLPQVNVGQHTQFLQDTVKLVMLLSGLDVLTDTNSTPLKHVDCEADAGIDLNNRSDVNPLSAEHVATDLPKCKGCSACTMGKRQNQIAAPQNTRGYHNSLASGAALWHDCAHGSHRDG